MVNDTNPLVSFLSNLGALLWCASCTICFFTAYSIQSKYRKKDFDFLLYSGIFSLILLFDDFFMVHDYLIYFWILQFAHLKVKISSGFWIVKAIPYQAWV